MVKKFLINLSKILLKFYKYIYISKEYYFFILLVIQNDTGLCGSNLYFANILGEICVTQHCFSLFISSSIGIKLKDHRSTLFRFILISPFFLH